VNTPINGVLDTKPYNDELNRSWIFRTVGYGHSLTFWKDLFSTLKMLGYEGVISIEHEDSLMSVEEGLTKAIDFLKEAMMLEDNKNMWWV
jgi:sugar phosphate isomerase/epimerase